jgi:hypothetical protein
VKEQKLAAALVENLCQGPCQFGDATQWDARLQELGISAERHARIASEGALLGSLIAHGVSTELGIVSDGAGQFKLLVHIACWIHAERPLTRMVPYSDEHRVAIEKVRTQIWEFYQELKAFSGSTRSESGRRARDTFASLKKTCRRLGVNFWEYLQDRLRVRGRIPPLAELIRQKGEEMWPNTGSAVLG